MDVVNAPSEQIIEFDQINGLIEAAGPDGAREILEAFWRSTSDLLAALREQITGADFENAARTAHAIKGSGSNVGAAQIAAIAKDVETACKSNDHNGAATTLAAMERAMDGTRHAFDAHLGALG